jgi:hypothetical protein
VTVPSTQRGEAYKLSSGTWGLWYYDSKGVRRRETPFPSKSASARLLPRRRRACAARSAAAKPDVRFTEFVDVYLERHAAKVRPRTIATLAERLRHAERRFGDVTLHEFERMVDEIAGWQAKQPPGIRYGRVQALRQTLEAAVRWGYMHSNPAKLAGGTGCRRRALFAPFPEPRSTPLLRRCRRPTRRFPCSLRRPDCAPRSGKPSSGATSTGDRRAQRSPHGVVQRRSSNSARRIAAAVRSRSPRGHLQRSTPCRFASTRPCCSRRPGAYVLNLNNFRNRIWTPAIEASGVRTPARIYDLRSTFASNALAAGDHRLRTRPRHGHERRNDREPLRRSARRSGASMATRLGAFEAEQERAAARPISDAE